MNRPKKPTLAVQRAYEIKGVEDAIRYLVYLAKRTPREDKKAWYFDAAYDLGSVIARKQRGRRTSIPQKRTH